MSTKFISWLAVLILGAAVLGAFWYASSLSPSASAPQGVPNVGGQSALIPQSSVTIPHTTSGSPAVSPQATSSALTINDQNGAAVPVRDFIHISTTIPDTANTGRYMLAGNLGYCSDPAKCQAATTTDFTVYYNSGPQSFTIALTQEPIGQARLDMEQFLLSTLGLTEQQLCSLNYYVGVTRYVNAQFTGKNLGFSFCPGAVTLPQ